VTVMRRLEPGDPGVVNHKSPTTLLLDPTGRFHSFGFTARDFYHDLSPREARRWLYFDKFKMALHNSKVTARYRWPNRREFSSSNRQLFPSLLRYIKAQNLVYPGL